MQRNSYVYGVEPNLNMRNVAKDNLCNYKKFKSVNAYAENTGLPDNSINFITAAQAFHWFDRE